MHDEDSKDETIHVITVDVIKNQMETRKPMKRNCMSHHISTSITLDPPEIVVNLQTWELYKHIMRKKIKQQKQENTKIKFLAI